MFLLQIDGHYRVGCRFQHSARDKSRTAKNQWIFSFTLHLLLHVYLERQFGLRPRDVDLFELLRLLPAIFGKLRTREPPHFRPQFLSQKRIATPIKGTKKSSLFLRKPRQQSTTSTHGSVDRLCCVCLDHRLTLSSCSAQTIYIIMKASAVLSVLLLVADSLPAAGASRKLHENSTVMSNGAELTVGITSPAPDSNIQIPGAQNATDVKVVGTATVGQGVPDVAYIYVIDSSGSTDEDDGACGTTLDCIQAFFEALNEQVITDGSAEVVAVIDFDSYAQTTAGFQNPRNPEIIEAINNGTSNGGTFCSHALETAALVALDEGNTATTTVVIFAGDGRCFGDEDEWDNLESQGENVTESANILARTGAIVHSVAVGDNIDCDPSNELNNIPSNGGHCFSIPDPNSLPNIIDDIIGTKLTKLEIKVDNAGYEALAGSEAPLLPQEGAASIDFQMTLTNLTAGSHKICVRATGKNTLGEDAVSDVEDCHEVYVDAPTFPPKENDPGMGNSYRQGENDSAPFADWKAVMLVLGCVAALGLAIAAYVAKVSQKGTEIPAGDLSLAEDVPSNANYSPPIHPVRVV